MNPETAARRFLCSLLLGGVLGVYYGFLRPLGRRSNTLRDTLFLPGFGWVWLVLNFEICRGDIRPGYFFGLLAGIFLWELTAGRRLRPLFSCFWDFVGVFLRILALPLKKFLFFTKKLFASAEKWVTIKSKYFWRTLHRNGGASHGRKYPSQEKQGGTPSRSHRTEDRSDSAHRIFYGSPGGPAVGTQRHPK